MNKSTGIIVAAILVLIVSGIVVKNLVFPSTEAPTYATSKPGFMEIIEVKAKIADVLGATPSGAGNAADHYAQAVALFVATEKIILDAAAAIGNGDAKDYPDALKTLEEIRGHIAAGAKQASMDYMSKHTSGKLQVSTHQDDVERLEQSINVLDILGDYYIKNKRLKDAEAMYRDMFVAGWHMINERSHIQMAMYGQTIQALALNGMSRSIEMTPDGDKQRASMRDYLNALDEFLTALKDKELIFRKARLDVGDIWNIAENDKDRAWRVQAILAMALIRFTHDKSKANNAHNNAMIEKFLNSADPLEKAAAQAAKAYTQIDFNMVNSTW